MKTKKTEKHHSKGMIIYRRDASTEDIYARDGDGVRFRLDDHGGDKRLDLIPCRGPRPKRADETADTSASVAEPARHLITEAAETASSPVCHYCGDAITNEDETTDDGAGHPVHAACQEAAEDAADELAQNDPDDADLAAAEE